MIPLRQQPPRTFHSHASLHSAFINSSKLSIKCPYHFMAPPCLLQVSRSWLWLFTVMWLWLFTCLSRFWICGLSCDLSFLIGPRNVIHFPFVSFLLLASIWVTTSKLFTWNWKSQEDLLHWMLAWEWDVVAQSLPVLMWDSVQITSSNFALAEHSLRGGNTKADGNTCAY